MRLKSLSFWSRFVCDEVRSDVQDRAGCKPVFLAPLAVAGFAALGLGGCAQQQQVAHSSEYFPQSVYGEASPRVVADGQDVPHGGGKYLVGHPYMVAGRMYYPSERKHYTAVGYASWYGDAFHGRRTANGEIFDRNSISAAHPTMPLPSYARVTNLGLSSHPRRKSKGAPRVGHPFLWWVRAANGNRGSFASLRMTSEGEVGSCYPTLGARAKARRGWGTRFCGG